MDSSENQKQYVNLLYECLMICDKLLTLPDLCTVDTLLNVHHI